MKGQNFRQLYESLGPQGTYEKVTSCLKEGDLKPEDFSLKELFIGCCGERAYVELGRRFNAMGGNAASAPAIAKYGDAQTGSDFLKLEESNQWSNDPGQTLREAGEAVDVSAFSAITGQIAFNAIGKGWQNAEFVGEKIFRNYPTPFSGEKIPWLSNLFGATPGDSDIHPQMPYPETTIGPRWVTSPRSQKKGGILSLSMEFILFDRTSQALDGLEKLGKGIRYDKEYMQLKVFLGLVNNYQLNGTAYNTYLTSGSNYVNAQSSTPLVDYTSVNNALYLRSKILDPDTGRPIILGPPKNLFVMPFAYMNASRILTATGTQTVYPAYGATSVNPPGNVKFEAGNPINWQVELMTSSIAYQLLIASGLSATQANAYWYMGNFQDAFWYSENFPFRTEQAMPNNIRQFEQDVQMRWKVSEMGVAWVYDPRETTEFWNT